MTACLARLTVITLALLGVVTAAHAQVIIANDFDAPNGFITILTAPENWVYPGFPTPFWGLSAFCVGDLRGKSLWKLVENTQRFPRLGGRVLCVHGAVSFHRASPCATR